MTSLKILHYVYNIIGCASLIGLLTYFYLKTKKTINKLTEHTILLGNKLDLLSTKIDENNLQDVIIRRYGERFWQNRMRFLPLKDC